MDTDDTATGNCGKDAQPHWNEVIAAQRLVSGLILRRTSETSWTRLRHGKE